MIIFGAIDFTAALARLGRVLGYHVTVCDARPVFATRKRFPMANEVVIDWPDRYLAEVVGKDLGPRDAVCVLTHDPKFDVPAIMPAVETKAGYLGVMGSRRTHDKRMERLREAGLDDDGLRPAHGPRSGSTSAPAPPRRRPCRSAPRSSPAGRAGTLPSLRDDRGPDPQAVSAVRVP